MTHEEISRQYTKLIYEFKENVNLAFGLYTTKLQEIDNEIAKLQEECDHDAPAAEFSQGACPFCHRQVKLEDW